MTGPLRQCGRPDCRLCNLNVPGEPPDCGHEERLGLAEAFIGMAAIVAIFALWFFVLGPVLA